MLSPAHRFAARIRRFGGLVKYLWCLDPAILNTYPNDATVSRNFVLTRSLLHLMSAIGSP